jgi:hypothetical protein
MPADRVELLGIELNRLGVVPVAVHHGGQDAVAPEACHVLAADLAPLRGELGSVGHEREPRWGARNTARDASSEPGW